MFKAQKLNGFSQVVALVMAVALQLLFVNGASADWVLDNERSSLSFTSTKNGKITEAHRFTGLSGTVDKSGKAEVSIDLLSVATGIDIRNERMREFLFETNKFAQATITASVEDVLKKVKGSTQVVEVPAELSLHGKKNPITLEVLVTQRNKVWVVSSMSPVMINASDYELAGGIDKLRQIAELASISQMVPVHFVLTFAKK